MKFLALLILLIVSEALLAWYLHDLLSTFPVVLIFLGSTIICLLLVLYLRKHTLPDRELRKKRIHNIKKKIKNKSALTPSEAASFDYMVIIGLYQTTILMVVIPGLITDLMGLIVSTPYIVRRLSHCMVTQLNEKATPSE